MRSVIAKVTELAGLNASKLYTASTGDAALDVLNANKVDLVITDLNMPRMDGLELVETMRRNNKLRGIPVVIVCSDNQDPRLKNINKFGVRHVLQKPISPDRMRGVIVDIIQRGSNTTTPDESILHIQK